MRPATVWRDQGAWFGLDRRRVLAVMREPVIGRVPGAPPWLRGVANRFGRAVPVIDCGALAGAVAELGPCLQALVVPVEGGEIALVATGVLGERSVALGGEQDGFFDRPADRDELRMIDLERLVAAIEVALGA